MSNSWPMVRLGEVLRKSNEGVELQPERQYREIKIKLWGKGVVLRGLVTGTEVAARRRQIAHSGQFILSRIDARNGALGIVPEDLDGAIVSNDFPVFNLNQDRLLPEYLGWLSRTGPFAEQCQRTSEGTTNRVRISEDRFLAIEILLPQLSEQQRIVTRINELAEQIGAARTLHEQIDMQYAALLRSIVFNSKDCVLTPMNQLLALRKAEVPVEADKSYHFAGVYSFGRGVFTGPTKSGAEFAYKRLTRLHTGDFVYPKLMAWEGALGVVPSEFDQLFVSPEFMVFEIDQNRVLPETLDVYFRTPTVWPKLSGESTGTNVRRRRLHPDDFLAYKMPLPSMQAQQRLRATCAQHAFARPLQVQILKELDSLLPSILDRAFNGEL
jgi:type I restriction enzyme S subunit